MTTTPWLIAFFLAASPPASSLAPVPLPENAIAKLGANPHRVGSALIAVTADSKQIVAVTPSGYYRCFNAHSGELLAARQLFEFVELRQTRVQHLSANGRTAVHHDTTERRKLVVQDLATGKLLLTYPKEGSSDASPILSSAMLSPDGQTLLVQDFNQDSTHYLISVATGIKRKLAVAEGDGSLMYQFSPDGKWLLMTRSSRGIETTWQLFDTVEAKPVEYEPNPVASTFSHDSQSLLAYDSNVGLLEIAIRNGEVAKRVELEKSETGKQLIAGPNGLLLFAPVISTAVRFPGIVASTNPVLSIWNSNTGKEIVQLPVGEVCTEQYRTEQPMARFAPDGSFAVTNIEGNLCVWELPSGRRRFGTTTPPGVHGAVTHLAFSPDARSLYCAGPRDSLGRWNLADRTWSAAKLVGEVRALAVGERGGRAMAVQNIRSIPNVWDADSGRMLTTINSRPVVGGRNSSSRFCAMTADSSTALLSYSISSRGDRTNIIEAWDVLRNYRKSTFTIPNDYGSISSFSPCGQFVVHRDTVLQVATGNRHFEMANERNNRRYGNATRFSPDGRLLFRAVSVSSALPDEYSEIWEVASGQFFATLDFPVSGIAFSPDGRTLAASTELGIVLVDSLLQRPWHEYPTNDVNSDSSSNASLHVPLVFSPDGKQLASGHRDGTVALWQVPGAPKSPEPAADEFDKLWEQLAHADSRVARTALFRLVQHPKVGLALMQSKFQPEPPGVDEPDARKLIAVLDSPKFPERRAAHKQLQELGSVAKPSLVANLKSTESVEVRSRVEELLDNLKPVVRLSNPGVEIRGVRAIEILERIGTPEAKKLLAVWANQTRDLHLSSEAEAAVNRMTRR